MTDFVLFFYFRSSVRQHTCSIFIDSARPFPWASIIPFVLLGVYHQWYFFDVISRQLFPILLEFFSFINYIYTHIYICIYIYIYIHIHRVIELVFCIIPSSFREYVYNFYSICLRVFDIFQ